MVYQKTYGKRSEMEFSNKLQRPLTTDEKEFLSWLDKKLQVEKQIEKGSKAVHMRNKDR